MTLNTHPNRQKALVTALKAIPRSAIRFSSNAVLHTAALGAAALAVTNIDPSTLPPTLTFFFGGLGIEAVGILLDRLTSGGDIDPEDICRELENIFSKSNIQEALNNPQFVHEFAGKFTGACLQIIQQIAQEKEGSLAVEVVHAFTGANLIHEDIRDLTTTITDLLSKADQKRNEQYDDVIRWINRLVQILHHQSVLSVCPKTKRPLIDLPVIGREDDLNWLRWRAERRQDCLLVGQPGSGKSFLFRKVVDDSNALFVVGNDRRQLEMAITTLNPSILMVDDAHIQADLLLDLKQIRDQTGLGFAIFANCWPSKEAQVKVQLHLSTIDVRELSLLSRDHIVAILKSVGVEEPWSLVYELVNQAEGRPGLAVTLADLYRKGGHHDIFSGEAVANHLVEEYIKHEVEANYSKQILAALSLGGDYGMSPTAVATVFELKYIEVNQAISEISAAGILFEVSDDFMSVRPKALRDVLIREVFFSGSLMQQSLYELLGNVPSLSQSMLTLLSAKHRGASIPDQFLRERLQEIKENRWRFPNHQEPWISYTALGPTEARWVLDNGAEYLLVVAPYVLRLIPEEVIPRLLDKAVGDNRELHSNPDHSLRIIQNWASNLKNENLIRDRKRLCDAVTKWHLRNGDPKVSLKAMMLAIAPRLETGESDPGEGNTYTIRSGYFTLHGIAELRELWSQVLEFLKIIPINDWQPLLDTAHSWLHYEMITQEQELTDDVVEAARNLALNLMQDIVSLSAGHQGVLRALENLTKREDIQLEITVQPQFNVLYPINDWENYQLAEVAQKAAVSDLANAWIKIPPEDVVQKLERFEREAQEAHLRYPRYSPLVCHEIAQLCADPLSWVDLMLASELPVDLVGPFMGRLSSYDRDIWMSRVKRCLESEKSAGLAISFVLQQSQLDEEAFKIVQPRLKDAPRLVEDMCGFGATPKQTILKLLQSVDIRVAVAAAKGVWHRLDKNVRADSDYFPIWRRIVIQHLDDDWMLSTIFEDDAELAYEWLLKQISRDHPEYYRFRRAVPGAIQRLEIAQKKSLLEQLHDAVRHGDLIEQLIDSDVALYKELIRQNRFSRMHLIALPRITHQLWPEMALVAAEAGYTPEEIAQVATRPLFIELLSQSEKADRWQQLRDAFSSFTDHENDLICQIATFGQHHCQQQIDEIRLEERRRSIYGRD